MASFRPRRAAPAAARGRGVTPRRARAGDVWFELMALWSRALAARGLELRAAVQSMSLMGSRPGRVSNCERRARGTQSKDRMKRCDATNYTRHTQPVPARAADAPARAGQAVRRRALRAGGHAGERHWSLSDHGHVLG
jgi:hypothetical protein